MSDVIAEIAAERRRQVEDEGWSESHDDEHTSNELAKAAAAYAYAASLSEDARNEMKFIPRAGWINLLWWMWPRQWADWHFKMKDRRRDLIRAGALIVAEIERLDRLDRRGPTKA